MAKKIVRGITDVKTINNQDFDTNNVNDLLSDGQYNYIHRKKGKNEEYHNLTDNIKTLSSDNTDLLTVTNNNKTTNTATLHPKHDAQKEQVLESTRNTVTIHHGTNGTDEKTTVDTNPQKVLEHENLISNSQYVTIEHDEDSNISEIKTDNLDSKLIELNNKIPTSVGVRNLLSNTNQGKKNWEWSFYPGEATVEDYNVDGVNAVKISRNSAEPVEWSFIQYQGLMRKLIEPNTKYTFSFDVKPSVDVTFSATLKRGDGGAPLTNAVQMNKATANKWTKVSCVLTTVATLPEEMGQVVYMQGMTPTQGNWLIIKNIKLEKGFIPSDWSPAPEDIYPLLAQKQDTLTAGTGITIQGQTISATASGAPIEGASLSIQKLSKQGDDFIAVKHVLTSEQQTLITYSFMCYPETAETAEHVLTGELKGEFENILFPDTSMSNGAISITNDGTNIKLINSAPSENVLQYGTFTLYKYTGGDVPGV